MMTTSTSQKYKDITYSATLGAPENPTFPDATGWTVSIGYGPMHVDRYGEPWQHHMTTSYYMGSAHGQTPPELVDVLNSLFMDDPGGADFDTWLSDSYDSGHAATRAEWLELERTYNTCVRNAKNLRSVLGDDYDAIWDEIEL